MLYYRDLILFENNDVITLTDEQKNAIEKSLENWAKTEKNAAHKNDKFFVVYDRTGSRGQQELTLEALKSAQMKISNTKALLDITVTDDVRSHLPKNEQEQYEFTCVIIKPNKNNKASKTEYVGDKNGIVTIPKGFEIEAKMSNTVLLNATIGSIIHIEYLIDEHIISVSLKDDDNKTDKPSSDTHTTTAVVVSDTTTQNLNTASSNTESATQAENDQLNSILK